MDEFSIPGSEPDDTTLGAFDLGPYSTVSQVTVPRISLRSETTAAISGISGSTRVLVGVTTTTSKTSPTGVLSPTPMGSTTSASSIVQTPSSTAITQVTGVSKAGGRADRTLGMITMSVAGALVLYVLII